MPEQQVEEKWRPLHSSTMYAICCLILAAWYSGDCDINRLCKGTIKNYFVLRYKQPKPSFEKKD
jgi:hypothetical protein